MLKKIFFVIEIKRKVLFFVFIFLSETNFTSAWFRVFGFYPSSRYLKQKCYRNKTKSFVFCLKNPNISFWVIWVIGLDFTQITPITQALKKLRELNWVKSNPITQKHPLGLNLTPKYKNYGNMIELRKNI